MKIAILEIAPKGHYTYVECLINVFSVKHENQVDIFTNEYGRNQILPLIKENQQIFIKNSSEEYLDFFKGLLVYDLVIAVTIEPNSKEMSKIIEAFLKTKFNSRIFFVIHNTHFWRKSIISEKMQKVLNFSNFKNLVYNIKVQFLYKRYSKKIINLIRKSPNSFVCVSKNVENSLKKIIPNSNIEVIPFSFFNKSLSNNFQNNSKLRICIPGLLDSKRRDYESILRMFEKEPFKKFIEYVEFDFLGGNSTQNSALIIEKFKKYINKGYNIFYYENSYLSQEDYDKQLIKSDILLFNINQIQDFDSQYGKTKDSGFIFNMIKAGKPGLIPKWYSFPQEFQSSVVIYEDFNEVGAIILNLIKNPVSLIKLKENAITNSYQYTPEKIFEKLQLDC